MADNLDIDQPIAEVDPVTKEIKATPYFETYLYNIVSTIGGEGSQVISELVATTIDGGKTEYIFGLVKSIKRQLEDIDLSETNYLSGLVRSLKKQVEEISHADIHILEAAVKQIQIDTARFISKIKTSNYTAINKDWVEARNGITVELPANPVRDDEIMISNGDGTTITIDGNGNNIKYTSTDTSIIIYKQGSSLHFHYFIDAAEEYWRVQ